MTITISASGISLDGPLVAGENVAVTVSGLSLAAEDKPTLALLARFPDSLLASVELAEDADAPGTWTGELDTATKQTALFFATARADERRDAALELVAGRVSIARLTVPMANSALCPKPDGSPFASPVYVPVPGPPGTGGDPYDQAPEMDGEASAGTSDEYARGDHRHPTDTTRQAVISDLAVIRSGAAAGATAVQPSALSAYRTASAQDAIDGAQNTAIAAKYTKPASGIPASDLASGVLPTALPNPQPLHVGAINYDGSTEAWTPTADTNGGYGIVTLESATNSTHADGYAATPLAVKTVADSVSGKADSASIAPAFSTSSTYAVGDYVTHEGLLYKCTTAVSTAGAWNAAKWSAVAVTDEMGADTPLPFDAECEYVTVPAAAYVLPEVQNVGGYFTVSMSMRIDTTGISDSSKFLFGNWRGDAGRSSQIFINSASSVTGYSFSSSTTISNAAIVGSFGTLALSSRGLDCGSASGSFGGSALGAVEPCDLAIGGCCILSNGDVENGNRAFDLASFFYNANGAVARDMVPVRVGTVGYLYDKVSGRLFGSAVGSIPLVPGPDKATPTITTPGRIVELTPAIRYSLPAAISVSDATSTAALADRAVNTVTVGAAVTTLNLTFPAAVAGYARDFFVRLDCAGTALATIALPSGETVDFGADALAGLTGKAGVHLALFTEVAANHWLASRRSAS